MAVRRVRPSQPLAPHGLPGHLVGFVEALRGQRDLGRPVGDGGCRPGDGESSASVTVRCCAKVWRVRCCAGPSTARPTTRCSTCGGRPRWVRGRSVADEDAMRSRTAQLPPDDVEAMRQMLLDLLDRERRPRRHGRPTGRDDRPNRGRLRQIQFQPRTVVLVVSGAQGDGAGRAGGQAAGGAARPLRRRAHPDPGADR